MFFAGTADHLVSGITGCHFTWGQRLYAGVPIWRIDSRRFRFTAMEDSVDDDGESVELGFGTMGVLPGTVCRFSESLIRHFQGH